MPRGITGLLQRTGKHRRLGIEPLRHAAASVQIAMREVRRDAPALRILSRGNRRARRRTNRRVHIKLLEPHSLLAQAIDVRRLRVLIPKAGKIPPPHVINEHEHDVRLRGLRKQVKKATNKDCYEWLHDT